MSAAQDSVLTPVEKRVSQAEGFAALRDWMLNPTGITNAPRIRQLDVRDDHVQALLIAMTDHLIRQRQLKVDPTLAEVEMLGVLTDMVGA